MDDPISRLRHRLRAAEPRDAQVLIWRLVDGRSREELARTYGISTEAFDVKLLRALRGYAGSLLPPPASDEAEAAAAGELGLALDAPPAAHSTPLVAAAAELRAHARELRAGLDADAQAQETSPARTREDRLRWALVALILGVVAYFYLRD